MLVVDTIPTDIMNTENFLVIMALLYKMFRKPNPKLKGGPRQPDLLI